ncbi:GTPase domain-containing protein [Achromobacter aegrifaciens]|uniref:GTPase domain-containing protein n=1 Tax=Achromobacter aegrifaciens TaxID=1287736 RepID=UPI000F748C9C|nr:GTPase domain-containing protein [Achromobacter aegrifaciens]RSF08858.1 hypothetical protein EGU54_02435 [Achromobacter aegrifaciens]
MVLPLIFVAIGVVSLLAGTTIALTWDEIVLLFKGKRIAVFGARGVGKTRFVKFLTTGSIPAEYKQTIAPEKAPSRRFELGDLDLNVKESLDVSGDKAAYGEWKKQHDQADIVFYLLRADRLIVGDRNVENRVLDDLKHIGDWLKSRAPSPQFFIVGTHCDLDAEFSRTSANNAGDYVDKFRQLPVVKELVKRAGGTQQAQVVLGSMQNAPDTEALMYQVFMQVKS